MKKREELVLAIPNYNGGRYLEETLQSIQNQDGLVRWWMQDAESSDDSLKIAKKFKTESDVVVSEADNGQTDALNRAFAKMGGDIIGWLNSDDCLMPGTAQCVLRAFRDNPDIDIVVGQVNWIDAEGEFLGHHVGEIETIEQVLDIYSYWWQSKQWVQPEVFYRRRVWEQAGPLDTRYNLAFDFAFWVQCLASGAKVMRLPETFVRFRLHDEQKSQARDQASDEIRAIVRESLQGLNLRQAFKTELERKLDFDDYQRGKGYSADNPRPSLLGFILRRPDMLLMPGIRKRISDSFRRRVGIKKDGE